MSNESDSFIDEVTEEVRRDRFYATLRRYGWIAAVLVVVIVGGAAWNEYRKASARSAAQALGDEILAAFESGSPDASMTALQAIEGDGDVQDLVTLLDAGLEMGEADREAALETLRPLAENQDAPAYLSDLAGYKMVMIGGDTLDPDVRTQLLDRLARPGAPYRPLALEQQIVDLAVDGKAEEAIAAIEALLQEPALTQGLRIRMTQMIVALGADLDGPAG